MRNALTSLVLLATASTAVAQTPAPEPKPQSWATIIDLAFSGASGNDRTVLLSSGFSISHLQTERYELELSGRVRYGRSEGNEVARNLRSGIKFDLLPEARLSPFFTIDLERDPFRKLDLRSSSGAGAKYTFWRDDAGKASISLAALHSYEDFTRGAGAPFDTRQSARWSGRFKIARELGERLRLENTSLYQPVWNRGGEYLLSIDTGFRVPMSQRISLTLSHSYDRDSMALDGVHKDDHLVKAGLTIESRW